MSILDFLKIDFNTIYPNYDYFYKMVMEEGIFKNHLHLLKTEGCTVSSRKLGLCHRPVDMSLQVHGFMTCLPDH